MRAVQYRHSMDRALEILAAGLLPIAAVVTHQFPHQHSKEAVQAAMDRETSQAIKVVFRP